nr:hypothetical protein [Inhella proteolytica]
MHGAESQVRVAQLGWAQAAFVGEHEEQIAVRLHEIRIASERGLEALLRRFNVTLALLHQAKQVVRRRVARFQAQGQLEAGACLLQLSLLPQGVGQIDVHIGPMWQQLRGLALCRQRQVRLALPLGRHAKQVPGLTHLRVLSRQCLTQQQSLTVLAMQ